MTTYIVMQHRLTDDQVTRINAEGWNGPSYGNVYMDLAMGTGLRMDGTEAPGTASRLVHMGVVQELFHKGWTLYANDLDEVFRFGNEDWTDTSGAIGERHKGASSISVGNVVLWIEYEEGTSLPIPRASLCAPMGWADLDDRAAYALAIRAGLAPQL